MDYSLTVLDTVVYIWLISFTQAFQEATVQTCYDEVFEARCSYSQKVYITQARYGAIEPSKCVDDVFEELGLLGCYANVTDIVGAKCNANNRCEIHGGDPEVVSSKLCKKGIPMYMDISYVCVPDTIDIHNCDIISVSRKMQYLLSQDIWDHHCFYDLEQNVNVEFLAETNLKIKMNMQYVSVQPDDSTSGEEAYIMQSDGERVTLRDESIEFESDHLTLTLTAKPSVMLIGFQAYGCEDLATPAYAWVSREAGIATVGCYHSDYEWKMSCVDSKWIGPRSNCTEKKEVIIKPTPTPERNLPHAEGKQFLTTDILFALIIGLTVLLCAIVITIGFVCLKRAKYTYEAKSAPYEMATLMSDPSNAATWQKAKLQGNNDTLILPVNTLQGQTLQLR